MGKRKQLESWRICWVRGFCLPVLIIQQQPQTNIHFYLSWRAWMNSNQFQLWVWCWSHVVFDTCSSVDNSLLRRTRERVSDPQSSFQSKQDENSYFQISLVMDYYPRLFCICSVLGNSFCPIVLQILSCSHHNLWGSHPSSPSLPPILGMKFGLKQKKKQKQRQKVGNFFSFFWQMFFLFEMTYGRATFMRQLKATG